MTKCQRPNGLKKRQSHARTDRRPPATLITKPLPGNRFSNRWDGARFIAKAKRRHGDVPASPKAYRRRRTSTATASSSFSARPQYSTRRAVIRSSPPIPTSNTKATTEQQHLTCDRRASEPETELKTDWEQIEAHNPSHVQLHDENEEIATSSWIPQDITDMQLEDEPGPSILKREDGNHILYANKINAIFGESESGKTWIAIEAVRQELQKGHCVFYMDFEDSARGIRGRLKTMGVDSSGLRHFRYANPDEGLTRGIVEVIQSEIQIHKPSLIVIDGVNAAMNLLGLDLEKNKDATTFSQLILRPLRMENACILTIDHVTKSKDTRGNYAIGAQAKRADIDGVAIAVDVAMPFGRGLDGCLNLKVTKDRPGFVRAICQDAKDLGVANLKSNKDGTITVTISGGTIRVTTKEQKLQEISNFFEQVGTEMGQNDIRKGLRQQGIEIGNQELGQALEQLMTGGFVDFRKQGQKYLYKFKNQFMIGDVNAWEAE
jgi:hypothetical protein